MLQADRDPITDVLQSVAAGSADPGPWVPYWMLKGSGGYLNWTCPLDNRTEQANTAERERFGGQPPFSSWLRPGTSGA